MNLQQRILDHLDTGPSFDVADLAAAAYGVSLVSRAQAEAVRRALRSLIADGRVDAWRPLDQRRRGGPRRFARPLTAEEQAKANAAALERTLGWLERDIVAATQRVAEAKAELTALRTERRAVLRGATPGGFTASDVRLGCRLVGGVGS